MMQLRQPLRRPLAGLTIVLLAATFAACGGHGTSDDAEPLSDAESSVDAGAFAPGDLVGLVKPGNSSPTSPATVDGGVWTQSFEVISLDPPEVMDFYHQQLVGEWDEQVPPAPLAGCRPSSVPTGDDTCSYQGTWARGAERLEISASPDSAGKTQIDLEFSAPS